MTCTSVILSQNYRSAEDIVQEDEDTVTNKSAIEELQKKLEETSLLCQSLLSENQSTTLLGRQPAAGKTFCFCCYLDEGPRFTKISR